MSDTETTTVDNTGDELATAVANSGEGSPEDETLHGGANSDEPEPDTFPRSYVEELRQENGRYRQRAQQADQLAQRLHTELAPSTTY